MASSRSDRASRRGERLAQARRLASQARQDRTTPWYMPLTVTSIGAGAAFDAFGRNAGFFYAIGLSLAFAALSWGVVRLVPSLVTDLRIERQSGPRMLLTILKTPVTTRGLLVMAAALPVAVALVKAVGYYAFGGVLIVAVVTGVALGVAWTLNRP